MVKLPQVHHLTSPYDVSQHLASLYIILRQDLWLVHVGTVNYRCIKQSHSTMSTSRILGHTHAFIYIHTHIYISCIYVRIFIAFCKASSKFSERLSRKSLGAAEFPALFFLSQSNKTEPWMEQKDPLEQKVTWAMKKGPWLVGLYRGWKTTQLYRALFHKPLRIPSLTIQDSIESRGPRVFFRGSPVKLEREIFFKGVFLGGVKRWLFKTRKSLLIFDHLWACFFVKIDHWFPSRMP